MCPAGDTKRQECAADSRQIMPHLHFPGGRTPDVVPVVGAARLHGHVVGLRPVPSHYVCCEYLTVISA